MFALLFFFILGSVCAADNITLDEDVQLTSEDTIDVQNAFEEESVDASEDSALQDVSENDKLEVDDASDNLALQDVSENDKLEVSEDSQILSDGGASKKVSISSDDSNVVKGNNFSVKVLDEDKNPIAGKKVHFTINGKDHYRKTADDGIARLQLNLKPGKYVIKYFFNATGYEYAKGQTKVLVISTSTSKVQAQNYVAYVGVKNPYKLTLKAGETPLAGRTVKITLNGKTFTKKTNSKGQIALNIKLNKGTYYLKYSYDGEKNIKSAKGSAKITVKKGMPTKIYKANSEIYIHKTTAPFKVKLVDERGNPLVSTKVVFKIKNKKYTKKTNKKGIATLNLKLNKGSYKLKVYFPKSGAYKKSSKTFSIKVKPVLSNNGIWLLSLDMKSVNFKTLKKNGVDNIFLNFKAFERYGKSYVVKWISNANSYGLKVHIWMQVFYSGGWQYPVKNGNFNYNLINAKIKEAKTYANVKGVAGVHFDYLRFPGNAYNYNNGMAAVNYFTKQAANAIHKINKNLVVSAAVMPEPSAMKTYYGQDIQTMSKYLDAIIPMVYKGNYNAGAKWIKSVTNSFVKMSKKAEIWTGLQTYRSDENPTKLSASELVQDSKAALAGGATGVILFRHGLVNYYNFYNI